MTDSEYWLSQQELPGFYCGYCLIMAIYLYGCWWQCPCCKRWYEGDTEDDGTDEVRAETEGQE